MAQPPYKKATKASQIKSSHNKGTKPNKDILDALLGDPIVNTKKNTKKAEATGEQTILMRMMYEYTNLYLKAYQTRQI